MLRLTVFCVLGVFWVLGSNAAIGFAQDSQTLPDGSDPVCITANGEALPRPDSNLTYGVIHAEKTISVPIGMAYVPAGEFSVGADKNPRTTRLKAYAIGKYHVTNAEYRVFLEATNGRAPNYWDSGKYPQGKGNHPVAYVSMNQAKAYVDWLRSTTGRNYTLPTSEQWEHAARGPRNTIYPWGNSSDVSFSAGELKTKFNFNAVLAVEYLTKYPQLETSYVYKSALYGGKKTTVEKITAYKEDGSGSLLSVGSGGQVHGWVAHSTNTGFIGTELFHTISKAGGNTSAVGAYEDGKSGFGCYDMAGNVWDWCDTKITATNGAERGKLVYEIRGGSWYATSASCKSVSVGEGRAPTGGYNTVGFRVALNLED